MTAADWRDIRFGVAASDETTRLREGPARCSECGREYDPPAREKSRREYEVTKAVQEALREILSAPIRRGQVLSRDVIEGIASNGAVALADMFEIRRRP